MATLPNERIQALDVLRGFALCGIVLINIYQTLGMRDLLATVAFVAVGRAVGLEGSDRWGAAIALGAGILVVQAVVSPLWLRRLRYGPMEWLWRCATWWRWMPIRPREVRATT